MKPKEEQQAKPSVPERLEAKESDVGGIPVARAIPQKARRLIGPWCFLDHIGPASSGPLMDVGPIRT